MKESKVVAKSHISIKRKIIYISICISFIFIFTYSKWSFLNLLPKNYYFQGLFLLRGIFCNGAHYDGRVKEGIEQISCENGKIFHVEHEIQCAQTNALACFFKLDILCPVVFALPKTK